MRLTFEDACDLDTVDPELFATFDGYTDHFYAAFINYPDDLMDVVAAWGTTGNMEDEPCAVLVVTQHSIITGYVDLIAGDEYGPDEDWNEATDGLWRGHDEPTTEERLGALLALYRAQTDAPYLIVHDADEIEGWEAQGFTVVPPPDYIPADQAVRVLVWGSVLGDITDVLRQRGLAWTRSVHRNLGRHLRHSE